MKRDSKLLSSISTTRNGTKGLPYE